MNRRIAKKALSDDFTNNDKIVDKIYDHFEQQLKEKDHEIKRLRKRLEQFEHRPARYESGDSDEKEC